MIEDFRQFNESHFSISASHVDNPPAEGLAEGVGREVLDPDMINGLDPLEMAIYHLVGQDRSVFAQEARLCRVWTSKSAPAVADMLLEPLIDFYLAAFPCLFLVQGEGSGFGENLFPTKHPQVGEPQPEEASATDEKGHSVVTIPIQPTDEVHGLVPFNIVGCRVLVSQSHSVEVRTERQ